MVDSLLQLLNSFEDILLLQEKADCCIQFSEIVKIHYAVLKNNVEEQRLASLRICCQDDCITASPAPSSSHAQSVNVTPYLAFIDPIPLACRFTVFGFP